MINIDINDPSVDPKLLLIKFRNWLLKHNQDYADNSFLLFSVHRWSTEGDSAQNSESDQVSRLLRVWETAGFVKLTPDDDELYVFC